MPNPNLPARASDGPSQQLVAVSREIDNRMAIVRASAAAGIDAERLKLVALTVFTRTPALLACDPVSVARAIVEAGQLGLEPTGLLGGAYLVPRGNQAVLMVGYRGLVMLAKRSGEVQRVEARVVRANDPLFEYGYGLDPYLRHVPAQTTDPGPMTHAYAIVVYNTGEKSFDVMSVAEVEAVRARSAAGKSGPWVTDYFEMAKKTVLRRLLKLAPLTVNVAAKLDEVDPEVDEAPRADGQAAALRKELADALEREYGTPAAPTSPALAPGASQPLEAAPVVTTSTAAPASATVVVPQATATQAPAASGWNRARQRTTEAPNVSPLRQPVAEPDPAPVAEPVTEAEEAALCGVVHPGLGVGPCVLPAGHPTREHRQVDGTRWSQGRA